MSEILREGRKNSVGWKPDDTKGYTPISVSQSRQVTSESRGGWGSGKDSLYFKWLEMET